MRISKDDHQDTNSSNPAHSKESSPVTQTSIGDVVSGSAKDGVTVEDKQIDNSDIDVTKQMFLII